jgi:hypothetical protein
MERYNLTMTHEVNITNSIALVEKLKSAVVVLDFE